jgi:hypothetical protein
MLVPNRTSAALPVRILAAASRSRAQLVGGARACTAVLALAAVLLFAPDASGQASPEPVPVSPAAPPTSPSLAGTAAAPPDRVEGVWRGIVFEGGARFAATWTLTQNANVIRGNVTENRISGSGYGKYAISGQVNANIVTYQADNWASRRPAGWCLPAGSLRYSRDSEKEYLAGQLRMNSTAGGCSAHMATAKRNLTSRGDTGRVMADCSNNTSAGACPRTGFGTIKLERELN